MYRTSVLRPPFSILSIVLSSWQSSVSCGQWYC